MKVAQRNGIPNGHYRDRVRNGWSKERASTEPIRREYSGDRAIYRGDEFMAVGSIKECAAQLGLSVYYIKELSGKRYIERFNEKTQEEQDNSLSCTFVDVPLD